MRLHLSNAKVNYFICICIHFIIFAKAVGENVWSIVAYSLGNIAKQQVSVYESKDMYN